MSYVNAPVHDLLIRIKNAYMARKTNVDNVIYSKFKVKILELLKKYDFIKGFEVREEEGNKKFLNITLKSVKNAIDDVPEIKFYSTLFSVDYQNSIGDFYPLSGSVVVDNDTVHSFLKASFYGSFYHGMNHEDSVIVTNGELGIDYSFSK
jgi:ribosomal protein S8